MKISFVLGHELPFPPAKGGGVNSLLAGLCKAFASLGHDVTAYSPMVPGRPNFEVLDGVRHVRVKGAERRTHNLVNVAAGIPYALRVSRIIEPCDVLSCHLWHGFLFTRFSRARVVTHTIHRDPKKFLLLFAMFDRIYSGSEAVTADATRVVPLLASKCRTVYNAVDFAGYINPLPRLPDGQVRFLYVGRFSVDKGLESFITGFSEAAARHTGIRFKSVGPMTAQEGGDEALVHRMRALVEARGLTDRVEFAEPIYDRHVLDKAISAADVVVLPSIGGETLNMSILECMRLGRAFLISDLPANAPLIIEGETGFWARAGDSADWAARILELASDPARLQRFGEAAYRYGQKKFSCENIAKEYLNDFDVMLFSKSA